MSQSLTLSISTTSSGTGSVRDKVAKFELINEAAKATEDEATKRRFGWRGPPSRGSLASPTGAAEESARTTPDEGGGSSSRGGSATGGGGRKSPSSRIPTLRSPTSTIASSSGGSPREREITNVGTNVVLEKRQSPESGKKVAEIILEEKIKEEPVETMAIVVESPIEREIEVQEQKQHEEIADAGPKVLIAQAESQQHHLTEPLITIEPPSAVHEPSPTESPIKEEEEEPMEEKIQSKILHEEMAHQEKEEEIGDGDQQSPPRGQYVPFGAEVEAIKKEEEEDAEGKREKEGEPAMPSEKPIEDFAGEEIVQMKRVSMDSEELKEEEKEDENDEPQIPPKDIEDYVVEEPIKLKRISMDTEESKEEEKEEEHEPQIPPKDIEDYVVEEPIKLKRISMDTEDTKHSEEPMEEMVEEPMAIEEKVWKEGRPDLFVTTGLEVHKVEEQTAKEEEPKVMPTQTMPMEGAEKEIEEEEKVVKEFGESPIEIAVEEQQKMEEERPIEAQMEQEEEGQPEQPILVHEICHEPGELRPTVWLGQVPFEGSQYEEEELAEKKALFWPENEAEEEAKWKDILTSFAPIVAVPWFAERSNAEQPEEMGKQEEAAGMAEESYLEEQQQTGIMLESEEMEEIQTEREKELAEEKTEVGNEAAAMPESPEEIEEEEEADEETMPTVEEAPLEPGQISPALQREEPELVVQTDVVPAQYSVVLEEPQPSFAQQKVPPPLSPLQSEDSIGTVVEIQFNEEGDEEGGGGEGGFNADEEGDGRSSTHTVIHRPEMLIETSEINEPRTRSLYGTTTLVEPGGEIAIGEGDTEDHSPSTPVMNAARWKSMDERSSPSLGSPSPAPAMKSPSPIIEITPAPDEEEEEEAEQGQQETRPFEEEQKESVEEASEIKEKPKSPTENVKKEVHFDEEGHSPIHHHEEEEKEGEEGFELVESQEFADATEISGQNVEESTEEGERQFKQEEEEEGEPQQIFSQVGEEEMRPTQAEADLPKEEEEPAAAVVEKRRESAESGSPIQIGQRVDGVELALEKSQEDQQVGEETTALGLVTARQAEQLVEDVISRVLTEGVPSSPEEWEKEGKYPPQEAYVPTMTGEKEEERQSAESSPKPASDDWEMVGDDAQQQQQGRHENVMEEGKHEEEEEKIVERRTHLPREEQSPDSPKEFERPQEKVEEFGQMGQENMAGFDDEEEEEDEDDEDPELARLEMEKLDKEEEGDEGELVMEESPVEEEEIAERGGGRMGGIDEAGTSSGSHFASSLMPPKRPLHRPKSPIPPPAAPTPPQQQYPPQQQLPKEEEAIAARKDEEWKGDEEEGEEEDLLLLGDSSSPARIPEDVLDLGEEEEGHGHVPHHPHHPTVQTTEEEGEGMTMKEEIVPERSPSPPDELAKIHEEMMGGTAIAASDEPLELEVGDTSSSGGGGANTSLGSSPAKKRRRSTSSSIVGGAPNGAGSAEGSLLEFERIEQEIIGDDGHGKNEEVSREERNTTTTTITTTTKPMAITGTRESAESISGSVSSLNEFEQLEREVRDAISGTGEEIMMLSDIREESEEGGVEEEEEEGEHGSEEFERVSTKKDDDGRKEEAPERMAQREEAEKGKTTANLEKELIIVDAFPLLMHTSVDSLDAERVGGTQFTTTTVSEGQRMETSVDSLELDLARKEMGEGGDDEREERDSLEEVGGQMSNQEELEWQKQRRSSHELGVQMLDIPTSGGNGNGSPSATGPADDDGSERTIFETVRINPTDGSAERLIRTAITRVRDPIHSRVRFVGTEDEQQVQAILDGSGGEERETIDEEGNVTRVRTIVERNHPFVH